MTLTPLYDIALCDDIEVYSFDLKQCESLSVCYDNQCFIGIDPFKIQNESDEKVKLAHELGHCETGSFYNMYAKLDIREKHEHTADKWAIKKLVPEDELKEACKYCTNRWELAEYFGVTEDFMQKVMDYYRNEAFK